MLSWAIDDAYSSLYVDGALTLRKKRTERGPFDRIILELLGAEAVDTEAEKLHGIELWEVRNRRAIEAFQEVSAEELMAEVVTQIRRCDLTGLAATLLNFDGIDLAPLAKEVTELLDHLLGIERRYHDWAFDLVLAALPREVAADWQRTRADRIPQPIVSVRNLSVRYYRNPATRFALRRLLTRRSVESFDV